MSKYGIPNTHNIIYHNVEVSSFQNRILPTADYKLVEYKGST